MIITLAKSGSTGGGVAMGRFFDLQCLELMIRHVCGDTAFIWEHSNLMGGVQFRNTDFVTNHQSIYQSNSYSNSSANPLIFHTFST